MKLEYPLSDVLPSIDHARDRLLARIYRYRQDQEMSLLTTDEDSALLYAYSKWLWKYILDGSLINSVVCSPRDWSVVQRDQRDSSRYWPAVWCFERGCPPDGVDVSNDISQFMMIVSWSVL